MFDCRRQRCCYGILISVMCWLLSQSRLAWADGSQSPDSSASGPSLPLGLQSYEPSAFGHTKQSDDVGYENIKISVKFPLMPDFTREWWGQDHDRLYFAFTGIFDFYINTRPSGPVVGKEFNPQFFWQHLYHCGDNKYYRPPSFGEISKGQETTDFQDQCYFALGYNHDSNGQIIDSPSQFRVTQRSQGSEAGCT